MMTFVLMPQIFCNSEVKLTQSTKLLEISLGEKKRKKEDYFNLVSESGGTMK